MHGKAETVLDQLGLGVTTVGYVRSYRINDGITRGSSGFLAHLK